MRLIIVEYLELVVASADLLLRERECVCVRSNFIVIVCLSRDELKIVACESSCILSYIVEQSHGCSLLGFST